MFMSSFEHGVAMHAAPSGNIFERPRICRKNLENRSGSQLFDSLLRPNDGEGTKKPTRIDNLERLVRSRHAS